MDFGKEITFKSLSALQRKAMLKKEKYSPFQKKNVTIASLGDLDTHAVISQLHWE
jgi:hypothetical protein